MTMLVMPGDMVHAGCTTCHLVFSCLELQKPLAADALAVWADEPSATRVPAWADQHEISRAPA